MKSVLIVGGGFAGLNAAKGLAKAKDIQVTLVDRRNHHLFQPLLYQVAMAGLSPADIAVPIRSLLARYPNIRVLQSEVEALDLPSNRVKTNYGELSYDYLILAGGSHHTYFGHDAWENYAPGLKTIEQATEIRRRVLIAFEQAELTNDPERRKQLLTFAIIGGGPTGVELAGAIGEMTRFTLVKDFRTIDATLARIILIEAGPRILPMFAEKLASRVVRDLEALGVQTWVNSKVTQVDENGVYIGNEHIASATVLWAAGVQASSLGQMTGAPCDPQGRVIVEPDLSLKSFSNVFVAGDMACVLRGDGQPLPGVAPVALQQGRYLARTIRGEVQKGIARKPFAFIDKGQMATIGRSRAIVEMGNFHLAGRLAWILWLVIHIYYLVGFRNRLFVVLEWAWSYLTFRRGARLIIDKDWRLEK